MGIKYFTSSAWCVSTLSEVSWYSMLSAVKGRYTSDQSSKDISNCAIDHSNESRKLHICVDENDGQTNVIWSPGWGNPNAPEAGPTVRVPWSYWLEQLQNTKINTTVRALQTKHVHVFWSRMPHCAGPAISAFRNLYKHNSRAASINALIANDIHDYISKSL